MRTGGITARRSPVKWYADEPAMRTRQVVVDVVVLTWCLLCIRIAAGTRSTFLGLREPAERLQRAGDALAEGPGPIGDAGERLTAAGTKAYDGVGTAASLLGVVVGLVLMGWVAAFWVPRRIRYAREAGAAVVLRGDVDLLAMRAATTAPLRHLAQLGPDPVARWQRGEPGAAAELATMHLHVLGVRPPRPASREPARRLTPDRDWPAHGGGDADLWTPVPGGPPGAPPGGEALS